MRGRNPVLAAMQICGITGSTATGAACCRIAVNVSGFFGKSEPMYKGPGAG